MNSKSYKIIKTILSTPGEWHTVTTLAYDMNLTSRQVSSVISAYEYLPLVKDRDNNLNRTYVMFDGTEEEAKALIDAITEEFYGISDEMKSEILDVLSPVAWMTVSDVVEDTNMNKTDVTRTLSVLKGVTSMTKEATVFYRRTKGVS